jgi:hypothetical protein
MTTSELKLATKSAATLRARIPKKALFYHALGKRAWEDKTLPMMQDPGEAIVQITRSKWGSKALWALRLLEVLPLQSCM